MNIYTFSTIDVKIMREVKNCITHLTTVNIVQQFLENYHIIKLGLVTGLYPGGKELKFS